PKVQKFLKHAERWAAMNAAVLVADSVGIEKYLSEEYKRPSHFIAYGADVFNDPYEPLLEKYDVKRFDYNMLMARMEPENNIETILKAHVLSGTGRPLLVIGKTENKFGKYLVETYGHKPGIRFLGGIYDIAIINNLRYFSHLYFHGHSVGGTNPSLLEAMGSNSLIAAHDNLFNRGVLGEDAFYFSDVEQLISIIRQVAAKTGYHTMLDNNTRKIRDQYNWPHIVDEYEKVLLAAVKL
ncbi:MAG TPA: DUF1972 domain-containing protein, partial [Chitinophagaceae bacterium]|nr:DUF1972 domain-containing protein [Chitinophagaceae bacterium]